MDKDKCFMLADGKCSGGIKLEYCGMDCPFRKTKEEQLAIEQKIIERFKSGQAFPRRPFRSRVTGEVIFDYYFE